MTGVLARAHREETGIGLIEIVVSILLLGLLALSVLPLLAQSVERAPRTASLATATQLVASEVGRVQTSDTCQTLTSQGGTLLTTVGSVEYAVVTTIVGTCPTTFPGTMRVTVKAGPTSESPLTTSDVLVYVRAAL